MNVLNSLKDEKNSLLKDIETKEKQKKEDIIKRAETLKLKIENSIKDMDLLGVKNSFLSSVKQDNPENFALDAISKTVPSKKVELSSRRNSKHEIPVSAFSVEDEIKTYKERNEVLTNFINMLLDKNSSLQATLNNNPSQNETKRVSVIDEGSTQSSNTKKDFVLWNEGITSKETEQDEVIGEQKKYVLREITKEKLDGYSKNEIVRIALILKHELENSKRKLGLANRANEYTNKKVSFLEEQITSRITEKDKCLIKSFENYILGLLSENEKISRAFEDTKEELDKLKKEFNIPIPRTFLDENSMNESTSKDGTDKQKERGINIFCGCV
jgi:hypothetical protein